MQRNISQIAWRLGIAAAVVALAAPGYAQAPAGAKLPYEAAKARLKQAKEHSIYNGQQSQKGAFPFVVALIQGEAENTEEGTYLGQYCGASLIADRWVVTGAQCAVVDQDGKKVAVEPDKVNVYAGSVDFKSGKRIKVTRVIVHPQFDGDNFNNDIALLELAEAAPPPAKPVALATPQTEAAVGGVGKKVMAAGWGEIETKELPQSLRHVEMDILDSATCSANIVKYRISTGLADWARAIQLQLALPDSVVSQERNPGKLVNDNMLCSGRIRTPRDTCSGDTGGPLFAKGANGQFTLVGITSWGEGCGLTEKGLFGIYTRVSRYESWVKENAK
jgi:secreted trypsin-like serine protease